MGIKRDEEVMDEAAMDFTIEELREFLEADLLDVEVDPEFRDRLRRRLWDMVVARARTQLGRKRHV
jgi:hypothetical protein